MDSFNNYNGINIVYALIDTIKENSAFLSEIDGQTGDGDHGINMKKGFILTEERINNNMSFSEGLKILGSTLIMDIGGSMGPIYGTFFSKIAKTFKGKEFIDKYCFLEGLENAYKGITELAGAQIGDKTLLDTFYPAKEAFKKSLNKNMSFKDCLIEMEIHAKKGWESTKNMIAKIGRASRLGERSLGYLDAGATSCYLILGSLSKSIVEKL